MTSCPGTRQSVPDYGDAYLICGSSVIVAVTKLTEREAEDE